MGRVCKRVKDTKANLKNERAKSDCNRYLGSVALLLNGNAKDSVMNLEDGKDCMRVEKIEINEIQAVCFSPVRFINAMPLRNELCKTPCKRQAGDLMGTPKTPGNKGRLSRTPRALANLLRTPKTPCSKSRFQISPTKVNSLLKTPKTPCFEESVSESRLESLPIDILVTFLINSLHIISYSFL